MSTEGAANSGGSGTSSPQKVVVEIAGTQQTTRDGGLERISQDQFNARIAEAEKIGAQRLLKRFGVKKDERAAVLAEIEAGRYMLKPTPAEGEPDYKAEYEKLKPIGAALEATRAELAEAHSILKTGFEEKFTSLPESVQKYLTSTAPKDDWRAQQKALIALESSGMLAAIAAQGTTAQPATEKQPAKPATTMAPSGPTQTTTAAKTAYEQYQSIVKSGNRILAAQFRQQHARAIEATQPK